METYEKFTDYGLSVYCFYIFTFKIYENDSEYQILSSFTIALQIEEKICLVTSILHSQITLVQPRNTGRGSKSQSSKHDKKGSERFEYSRLQMTETKMEAVKKTIANELHSEIEIICQR